MRLSASLIELLADADVDPEHPPVVRLFELCVKTRERTTHGRGKARAIQATGIFDPRS
jgi:hypothetical protein